ncbi:MAG: tRNA (adenosine(37)-N6)-threonylcarbamoyltransferase complex ATPase subunit type 1 TsaE [Bacteroidetes bacterium]|nr:tRNA (adenosine(37)-N6)-threonylcarbamoyltransferase complex ATPase subunit type 1 TsaE [Bacteroidota bacterium]
MTLQEYKISELEKLPIVAHAIADKLKEYPVVAFYGEMGAGKTTLIKLICNELGVMQATASPTFAIVNEYVSESGRLIYHFDCYRLNSHREFYDLGYEEYFYGHDICLIEWPEKVEGLLPPQHLIVRIIKEGESRIFKLSTSN